MSKFWNAQPLYTTIVEILLKKGGALTERELYRAMGKSSAELSWGELNRTLMRLEVDGIIHVSNLTKNQRRIELRKT